MDTEITSLSRTPPAIAAELRFIATEAKTADVRAIAQRLAEHPRMRHVWGELLKRSRKTGALQHPAAPLADEVCHLLNVDGVDAEMTHNVQMRAFLFCSIALATLPLRVEIRATRARADLIGIQPDFDILDEIDVDDAFKRLPAHIVDDEMRRSVRCAVASSWDVLLFRREVYLFVKRGTVRSARARAVGIGVAGMCESIFGSRLYGTAATITSTLLETDVRPTQIREWCAGPRSRKNARSLH